VILGSTQSGFDESSLLVCKHPTVVSSHGERGPSEVHFVKPLIHSRGLHSHYLITTQSCCLLISSHWKLGSQHRNLGGHKHLVHSNLSTAIPPSTQFSSVTHPTLIYRMHHFLISHGGN
jgi:hypothetical protein